MSFSWLDIYKTLRMKAGEWGCATNDYRVMRTESDSNNGGMNRQTDWQSDETFPPLKQSFLNFHFNHWHTPRRHQAQSFSGRSQAPCLPTAVSIRCYSLSHLRGGAPDLHAAQSSICTSCRQPPTDCEGITWSVSATCIISLRACMLGPTVVTETERLTPLDYKHLPNVSCSCVHA